MRAGAAAGEGETDGAGRARVPATHAGNSAQRQAGVAKEGESYWRGRRVGAEEQPAPPQSKWGRAGHRMRFTQAPAGR